MSTVTAKKKRGRSQKVEPVVEPPVDYPDPLEEEIGNLAQDCARSVETPKPLETREEGVRCPKCWCKHCPADSGPTHHGQRTYRYRKCRHCHHRFRAVEVVIPD